MADIEATIGRLGRLPLVRYALVVMAIWGLAAGLVFTSGALAHAWAVFIGGYQSLLLAAALIAVLRSMALRRGEWGRALVLGFGTTLALTTLYLGAAALGSALAPDVSVQIAENVVVHSRPNMARVAPGLYLGSLAAGAVLGPGLLMLAPAARLRRRLPLRMPAPLAPLALYRSRGCSFQPGALTVRTIRAADGQCGAPAALTVHAPAEAGDYPVVLFQHGFMLHPACFERVLRQLASHGFVVVAPHMGSPGRLPIDAPSTRTDAEIAERVVDWIPLRLRELTGVRPRVDALGVAGHSRGAKVAWRLLHADSPIRAAAAIDPVDGAQRLAGDPPVLGEVRVRVPALVIGTEFGPRQSGPLAPPCAPTGVNHAQFFASCGGRAWHAVVRGHGHLDMLDEGAAAPYVRRGMCAGGADREAMRRTTAGLLTAFFRATLQGDQRALAAIEVAAGAPLPLVVSRR